MTRELFDPTRLRKRWAPEKPAKSAPAHPKLAAVATPVDSLAAAKTLLTEICERARRELPEYRQLLEPFFEQAQRELQDLLDSAPDADLAAMQASAALTLDRLEDLLEAYYFLIPRVR